MLEVRLFATLRQGREKVYHLDAAGFPDGIAVLDHLHIPKEEVAIFLRNGFHSPTDTALADGDIVAIFPPTGGG